VKPLDHAVVIRGERVRLMPPRIEQASTMARWVSDPTTRHLLGGTAYQVSVGAEEDWLRPRVEGRGRYSLFLCIETIDTPEPVFIGTIELRHIHAEFRTAEVGILVGEPDYRGRGYGTDAMRALCRFAFAEIDLQRIRLDVHEYNVRAVKSYEKAGFRAEGRLRRNVYIAGRYYDTIPMSLLAEEFEAAEAARDRA
jgi:RimJ/RimL family protein N-acetyltransferase